MEYITQTAEETKEVGRKLSANITNGSNVFALSGDLGAGKTTFVQGFAEGLGITSRVNSPTFIIMRTYDIPVTNYGLRFTKLYHIDLYRLEEHAESEVEQLGLKEVMEDENNIVMIEWAERINDMLPGNTTWVRIENLKGDKRKITI